MHLDIQGSGPVLLLLHGMPQRPGSCWQLGQHFTDAYTVVVPSLPGYGESAPLKPYDFAAAEVQLIKALASHGIDAVHAIIGYSGGAYRALRLVVDNPLQARVVALYGALAGPLSDEHKALFRQFATALRANADLGDAVLSMAEPASLERDPGLADELRSWLAAPDAETLASELEAFSELPRITDQLGKVAMPALVMVGEGDLNTPVAESREVASALPNAILKVVPDARHALWWEAEEACVNALRALLARV